MTSVIVKPRTGRARAERHATEDDRERRVLLAMRGLEATAFSDVLERSGAPRGSIYHHFPDGKDQLVEAAIELAGERALGVLDRSAWLAPKRRDRASSSTSGGRCSSDRTSGRAARSWRSRWPPIRPISLDQAATIFRAWRGRLAELYRRAGWTRMRRRGLRRRSSRRAKAPWSSVARNGA